MLCLSLLLTIPASFLQLNTAQPLAGQTTCTNCTAGEETFDDGNTVCSKCAKGFYNPSAIPAGE